MCIRAKKVALILTMFFVFSLPVTSVQAQGQDISGHWAEAQIEGLIDKNIISGYPDNTFKPDKPITRAEFITITNKVFGFTRRASINYSDVQASDWFAADIARAKAAGYISGYEDGTMRPQRRSRGTVLLLP